MIWRNRKAAGHRIRLAAAQLLFLVDASLLAMRLPFLPSQRRDSFAIVHVNHRWQQRVRPASVSQDTPRLGNVLAAWLLKASSHREVMLPTHVIVARKFELHPMLPRFSQCRQRNDAPHSGCRRCSVAS